MGMRVEICLQGIESALAAERGGADRIELCEDLAVGGVTPNAGMIAQACRRLAIPIHVIVRPRGGGFVYSEAEYEVMRHDVEAAKALGAAAVVIGLLRPDGTVDRERTARLIEAARPMTVTFHKAFDEAADPFEALDVLMDLGVDRLLTSGQARTAREGLDLLAGLLPRAAGRLAIMAGSGVTMDDIPKLAAAGLREIHIFSSACTDGRTDAEKVRRLVALARSCGR